MLATAHSALSPVIGVGNTVSEADKKIFAETTRSSEKQKRAEAMTAEIMALEINGWDYKTKTDASGTVEKDKAGLVACGNEQRFDVNYTLTFAAFMDLGNVKVALCLLCAGRCLLVMAISPTRYTHCITDMYLHNKRQGTVMAIVGVSVDDSLFTASTSERVDPFFHDMVSLAIQGLGYVSKFLGMRDKVTTDFEYTVDQHALVEELLVLPSASRDSQAYHEMPEGYEALQAKNDRQ
ncbi:hypothetical protein ON010_g2131 [Phytophthora cinnamomi]|nr:hypothetical protein ON010_g2131 [Phytophthora cinnamomi]